MLTLPSCFSGNDSLSNIGGKEERNGVAAELDGHYKAMMSSKYSKVGPCVLQGIAKGRNLT